MVEMESSENAPLPILIHEKFLETGFLPVSFFELIFGGFGDGHKMVKMVQNGLGTDVEGTAR